jgi:hypothetical protein
VRFTVVIDRLPHRPGDAPAQSVQRRWLAEVSDAANWDGLALFEDNC